MTLWRLLGKVEITSGQIIFDWPGQEVETSIDSFLGSEFGVSHGSVIRVASDVLPPD